MSDKLISRNWKEIYDNVTEAVKFLSFDAEKEPTPRAKIKRALQKVVFVSSALQKHKITRLGRFKIRQELTKVSNSLEGLRNGLEEELVSEKRCGTICAESITTLRTISLELTIRAERELIEAKVTDYNARHNQIVQAQDEIVQSVVASKPKAEPRVMTDMKEAMQKLQDEQRKRQQEQIERMKQLEENAKKNQGVEFTKPTLDHLKDTWVMRDERAINNVVQEYEKDRLRLEKEIKKSDILSNSELGYMVAQGPVLIRCSVPIREEKLKDSGVKYSIFSFPPVKVGGDPVNPGGGKREFISPMLILSDQVLIIFGKKFAKFSPPKAIPESKKKMPILKTKPAQIEKPIQSEDIAELRKDICAIMQTRTGVPYLDVLNEVSGDSKKFITSKAFPGVRIIWLIRKNLYSKIGPFTLQEVGMPF